MMNEEKYEKLFSLARIAEKSDRNEDTIKYLEEIIKNKKEDLTPEERTLLSTAYKDCVSFRRSGWRAICDFEEREKRIKSKYLHIITDFKSGLEKELNNYCKRMIKIIDGYLLVKASTDESQAFYYKLKADYYRYLAEFVTNKQKEEATSNALKFYENANEKAKDLLWSNPVKVGISLNLSVFYYEIAGDYEKAKSIAKNAIDQVNDLKLGEKDPELVKIFQTIQENMETWKTIKKEKDKQKQKERERDD